MASAAGPSSGTGTPYESHAMPPPMTRVNSGSSDRSSLYNPLTPGFYTLPIHGSCPRCHHRHQAATVRIRIKAGFTGSSKVSCERCHATWFAVGGGNSTTISLLSQQTRDPDHMEVSFRNALIEMVRSATSIASPTALAEVSEPLSRIPSRVPSARSTTGPPATEPLQGRPTGPQSALSSHADRLIVPPADNDATDANSPRPTRFTTTATKDTKKRRLAMQFKRLSERFPFLKKLRLGHWKHSRKSKISEKRLGKLPMTSAADVSSKEPGAFEAARDPGLVKAAAADRSAEEEPKERTSRDPCAEAASAAHSFSSKDFDMTRDELRKMSETERITWVRKQFSAFDSRCNCADNCSCRRAGNSDQSTSAHDENPPLPLVPPISVLEYTVGPRRSIDMFFTGIGDLFVPPSLPYPASIASTNTSQAPTLWEGMPATSAPPNTYLDTLQQRRHRSPPSRPNSLPPGTSPLTRSSRFPLDQDNFYWRLSSDSFSTGGPVGSVTGVRRSAPDTRSMAPPPHTHNPGSQAPTSSLIHSQLPPDDSIDDDASHGSTTRINGHPTPDDRSQDGV